MPMESAVGLSKSLHLYVFEALGQTCDNVDSEITPVADNRTIAGTEYFEKAMKETPI